MRHPAIPLSCILLLTAAVSLGQAVPPQTPPTSTAQPPAQTGKEKEIEKKEQSQRALGVLPQFLVTSRQDAPPLTTGQKFHLFAKQAFDPVELGLTAAQAGLSQAQDEFPAYGQGAAGYAKRYGAALGDEVSAGFWSNFFYPSLFKEDPRYFRVGEGSFGHRAIQSMKEEFVCHTDKGGRSFSYANVLGAFTAGGISNIYYPRDDRGFGLTMSRATIALAYGMAGGLFEEFYPDLHHKFFHRQNKTTHP